MAGATSFATGPEKVAAMITTQDVTVDQVIRENIPLPFPLLPEENELYIGEKITRDLGVTYTSLEDGMEKAYAAFKRVYQG